MEEHDDLDDDWESIRRFYGGRGRFFDLKGKRFGRLEPQEKTGHDKQGSAIWKCLCDCGNYVEVSRANLRKGRVKSCGCMQREYRLNKKDSTHV